MKSIEVFKLGRNPISGELPLIKTFSKVIQFNCNFCALSGTFPDTIFDYMPSLQISYWDGNGFTGYYLFLLDHRQTTHVGDHLNPQHLDRSSADISWSEQEAHTRLF